MFFFVVFNYIFWQPTVPVGTPSLCKIHRFSIYYLTLLELLTNHGILKQFQIWNVQNTALKKNIYNQNAGFNHLEKFHTLRLSLSSITFRNNFHPSFSAFNFIQHFKPSLLAITFSHHLQPSINVIHSCYATAADFSKLDLVWKILSIMLKIY